VTAQFPIGIMIEPDRSSFVENLHLSRFVVTSDRKASCWSVGRNL
jgi:hypothetical protein